MKEWKLETCCKQFKESVLDENDRNVGITTSTTSETIYFSLHNDCSELCFCPYCGKSIQENIKITPVE